MPTPIFSVNELVYVFEKNQFIRKKVTEQIISVDVTYKLKYSSKVYLEENLFRTKKMYYFKLNNYQCLNEFDFKDPLDLPFDLTAFSFKNCDFDLMTIDFQDKLVDGCNFTGANPSSFQPTLEDMKNSLQSWHPVYTKWIDGSPFGF